MAPPDSVSQSGGRRPWPRRLLLTLPMLACPASGRAALAPGSGRFEVAEPTGATQDPLPVWYHRPASWRPGAKVVVVLHGMGRHAEGYRDAWAPHAEHFGFLVVVAEFSRAKYPGDGWYNDGAVLGRDGSIRPQGTWSFFALDRAVAAALREAGAPAESPVALYGHSAGAQFAHRYLLLTGAPHAEAVVIANAGSYTLPDLALPFVMGLAGTGVTAEALRGVFDRRVTILLGEEDTNPHHRALPHEGFAEAEGPNRLARGGFFFEVARRSAEGLGCPFRWRLATVPGVAHSNRGMAAAAAAILAA